MTNAQISDAFDEIADILEFQGANPFRVRAYRNAARTIRDLSVSVVQIIEDEDRPLTEIQGIGDDLAEKITALVSTGSLEMLDKLRQEVPESVLALMRIPGLGPKKAAVLHKELGITSLDEVRQACLDHKVRELKGFGAKTEETILKGIDIASQADVRMYWATADEYAQAVIAHLRQDKSVRQIEAAGSYRRGRETVGDLDILVDSGDAAAVMDRLGKYEGLADVIARGDTKMSIRLASGLQIDLRVVPEESFGAALQYFTGSKDHNVVLRGLAKERGLKINEWGVFRVGKGKKGAKEKTVGDGDDDGTTAGEYIAGRTEKEVYDAMDLPLFPPELREARWEFAWAAAGELPKLVELDDLQGDLHMHTTASDGKASLEEMVEAARGRGLKYIAITDHSKRVSMANGLDGPRLLEQWDQIDRLNDRLKGITVLKGVEVDILEMGGLDIEDEFLAEADWVVASVHYGQRQSRAEITKRILGALANRHVCAIAHPTGRLINRREPYEVDLDEVMKAAADHGKLLELNANPKRLDLNDIHCAQARERGIPIVINTDAHSTAGLDVARYGILQARRGGLTKAEVANARSWAQMRKLIGR